MADFGSNFTDAFSAVYGAGLKSRQMAKEETRAAAQEAREQANFKYTQEERQKKEKLRGIIAGAGNPLKEGVGPNVDLNYMNSLQGEKRPNSAFPTMADMQAIATPPTSALPAPPPAAPAAPMAAPAAPMAALPTPAAPTPPPAPAAPTPVAAIPTPNISTQEGMAGAAPTAPDLNVKLPAKNTPLAIRPVDENYEVMTIAPDTPVIDKANFSKLPNPNPDDFVETLLNGRHVYVPKDKVTKLSAGDLAMAQGQAVMQSGLDPVLGMSMLENAQRIQKNTLEATSAEYGRAVLAAQATGNLDALVEAQNKLYPTSTKSEYAVTKDGIVVSHYILGAEGRKIPVGEPETFKDNKLGSAKDQLFARALAMRSPEAMVAFNAQENQDIVSIATMTNQQAMLDLDEQRFEETKRSNKVTEGQRNVQISLERQRLGAEGGYTKKDFNTDMVAFRKSYEGRAKELRETDPSMTYPQSVAAAKSEVLSGMPEEFQKALGSSASVVEVPGSPAPGKASAIPTKGRNPLIRDLTATPINPVTKKPFKASDFNILPKDRGDLYVTNPTGI